MKAIDITAKVEPIIKQAGSLLLSEFRKPISWHEKKDAGIVTAADLASEAFLKKELEKVIPGAAIFAEESGEQKGSDYCWVIDPLDGTGNFSRGIPYFCVSIGLTYKDKPIWGGIYIPLLDEFFYAEKGKGAFCNKKPIRVAEQKPLSKSFIAIGVPYPKDEYYKKVISALSLITPQTYGFRHIGAIAVDQAYVAMGRFDGLFFTELGWYDIAAGMLLIEEAGGVVTTFEGGLVDKSYKTYVTGNPQLHQELLKLIEQAGAPLFASREA
jgi:myo-inositol-1(or 4)-monophosphatase